MIKLRIFGFFFFGAKDERQTTVNLTFIVHLGKTPTEAVQLLQEVMVMTQCQELVFLNGTGGSKKEERRWKMITGVGGHPQPEQMKMLSE